MTTKTRSNIQKVWDTLNETVAGVTVQELCAQLTLTFEEVMTAVRWIARDHNIGLSHKDGCLVVISTQTY